MGVLIVFEGGDGAGKSTQSKILAENISLYKVPVLLSREPGSTKIGESIRNILQTSRDLTQLTELLLFSAARSQLVETVVLPALESGQVVICDRFTSSTVAYQGYGRGLDLDLINSLNIRSTAGVRPDLTVLLDIPIETGILRRRNKTPDVFESAQDEFHARVRKGYLEQASQDPAKWLVLDGTNEVAVLSETIWARVKPLIDRVMTGI